jgi:hypothetical protein
MSDEPKLTAKIYLDGPRQASIPLPPRWGEMDERERGAWYDRLKWALMSSSVTFELDDGCPRDEICDHEWIHGDDAPDTAELPSSISRGSISRDTYADVEFN